jgi:hypothetical protein
MDKNVDNNMDKNMDRTSVQREESQEYILITRHPAAKLDLSRQSQHRAASRLAWCVMLRPMYQYLHDILQANG